MSKVCPKCWYPGYTTTLACYVGGRDENDVVCNRCHWQGKAYELVENGSIREEVKKELDEAWRGINK